MFIPAPHDAYIRHQAERRITIIAYGGLTVDDILEYINQQITEQTWACAVLYETDGGQLPSPYEMHRVIGRMRMLAQTLGRRGPVAVVSRHPSAVLIAREYAAAAVESVRFFDDRDAAEEWLARQPRLEALSNIQACGARRPTVSRPSQSSW